MTNYEMTEKLSEKMGVTMEKAREALEASNWDMLDASILLEQELNEKTETVYTTKEETRKAKKEEKPIAEMLRKIGSYICKLIRIGNRNKLEIWRKDEMIVDLPVTAAVILVLLGNWLVIALLIVGMFTGFKYRFSGEELGKESINAAIEKVTNHVDKSEEKSENE